MKLAVMQPYFLPHVGYFQLISAVDKFVLYDDVAFMKGGWINRNFLLLNEKPKLFTIPLANGESGVPINEVVVAENFNRWRDKFFKTLHHAYAKSANYSEVLKMLEKWLASDMTRLVEINRIALSEITRWLGISTQLVQSSEIYKNTGLGRAERLVDICRQEGADTYVNAEGGRALYEKSWFRERGIELGFLDPSVKPYPQAAKSFVPNLSILDLMMNLPKGKARSALGSGSIL